MKRFPSVATLVLIVVAVGGAVSSAQAMKGKAPAKVVVSESSVELRLAMKKLWEDHITYTRNYIISALAGLEDVGRVAERLLKNQDDIGDAIKPFYGDDAGKKLTALLREHNVIATEVVKAAQSGTSGALAKANKKWRANADEIAAFLSSANPRWPKAGLQDMFYGHLEFNKQEVVARL